jgi:hypothetical protein
MKFLQKKFQCYFSLNQSTDYSAVRSFSMVYQIILNINKLNAGYFLKRFERKSNCVCKRVSVLSVD